MKAKEFRQVRNGAKVIVSFQGRNHVAKVAKKSHPKASQRKLLLLFFTLDGGVDRVWRSIAKCKLTDNYAPMGPIDNDSTAV